MNDLKDLDEIPLGASHNDTTAKRARAGVRRAKQQLERWQKLPRWKKELKNQRKKQGLLTK